MKLSRTWSGWRIRHGYQGRCCKFSSVPLAFPVFKDRPTTFYICGPTVYDDAHIGHARTYICFDVIRRILTDFFKIDIVFSMGITDIDDKIIDRARSTGDLSDITKLTRQLESKFFNDMDNLNVKRPDVILRVSEHVDNIISYIQRIESNGFAYHAKDGIYFNVPKLGCSYGKLGNIPPVEDEIEGQPQDEFKERIKQDKRDFALWKSVKSDEPYWVSPWGPGRPGWHIECSAMIHSVFGEDLDVHGGGIDLMFPHHTNEIAQCEAHNGRDGWVKKWIHTGHLHIAGRKMSKSLKNFITIQNYLDSNWTPSPAEDLRLFCLQHKYHATLHFTEERIQEAGSFRRKVEAFLHQVTASVASPSSAPPTDKLLGVPSSQTAISASRSLRSCRATFASQALIQKLTQCRADVRRALADDFDTPMVLRLLGDIMGSASQHCIAANKDLGEPLEPVLSVRDYVLDILGMLGLPWKDITLSGMTRDSSKVGGPGSVDPQMALTDALISFRGAVRNRALDAVKEIKQMEKRKKGEVLRSTDDSSVKYNQLQKVESESSSESSHSNMESEKIASKALSDILRECDRLRDEVAPTLGVSMQDFSRSSTAKVQK